MMSLPHTGAHRHGVDIEHTGGTYANRVTVAARSAGDWPRRAWLPPAVDMENNMPRIVNSIDRGGRYSIPTFG
jgi:hypothetical protein